MQLDTTSHFLVYHNISNFSMSFCDFSRKSHNGVANFHHLPLAIQFVFGFWAILNRKRIAILLDGDSLICFLIFSLRHFQPFSIFPHPLLHQGYILKHNLPLEYQSNRDKRVHRTHRVLRPNL